MAARVVLVKGDDGTLVADALRGVVREAVGDADPSMVVEELAGDDYLASAIVDAAQTPPFLADRRVVVARDIARFSADELRGVIDYLSTPLDTTVLVLVHEGGRLSQPLSKAITAAKGKVVDASKPSSKGEQGAWWAERLKAAPVRLAPPARAALQAHLGDDVARVGGILDALAAAYGVGATVGESELQPFLGAAGAVKPWDLTDALDRGDTPGALQVLHRLTYASGMHSLQVMAILGTHYNRALRLDGADARTEADAADLLGVKGFPAKKALDLARRLGHDGVVRSIELLADADLELRGTRDWPDLLVLEVLVARLSRLVPGARGKPRSSTAR